MNGLRGERAWVWLCRSLAVVVLGYLLVTVGIDQLPWGAYLLLLGLFFGPEAIRGQIQINRRVNGDK